MRHFILVLMLLILPWKAFASTMDAVWHEASHFAQFIEHEMEHKNGVEHHHHNDASVHYDNSETSKKHLRDHLFFHHIAACEIGVLVSVVPMFFVFSSSQALVPASTSVFPNSISLKGLRRPPRVLG